MSHLIERFRLAQPPDPGQRRIELLTGSNTRIATLQPDGKVVGTNTYTVPIPVLRQICDLGERFEATWQQLLATAEQRPDKAASGWHKLPPALLQLPYQVELVAKPEPPDRPYPEVVATATGEDWHQARHDIERQMGQRISPTRAGQHSYTLVYSTWENGAWHEGRPRHLELPYYVNLTPST